MNDFAYQLGKAAARGEVEYSVRPSRFRRILNTLAGGAYGGLAGAAAGSAYEDAKGINAPLGVIGGVGGTAVGALLANLLSRLPSHEATRHTP